VALVGPQLVEPVGPQLVALVEPQLEGPAVT
jgi:hypothetical protein